MSSWITGWQRCQDAWVLRVEEQVLRFCTHCRSSASAAVIRPVSHTVLIRTYLDLRLQGRGALSEKGDGMFGVEALDVARSRSWGPRMRRVKMSWVLCRGRGLNPVSISSKVRKYSYYSFYSFPKWLKLNKVNKAIPAYCSSYFLNNSWIPVTYIACCSKWRPTVCQFLTSIRLTFCLLRIL